MTMHRYRYTISVDLEMLKQVDDYRYENRFQTRADATAELIRRGLEFSKKMPEKYTDFDSTPKTDQHFC